MLQHRMRPGDVVGCAPAPLLPLLLHEARQRLRARVCSQRRLIRLRQVLPELRAREQALQSVLNVSHRRQKPEQWACKNAQAA